LIAARDAAIKVAVGESCLVEEVGLVDNHLPVQVHLLRSLLELYSSDTPEAEVLTTLERLEHLGPLSVRLLRETLVGKALNMLMKRTPSVLVRERAKALLSSWRGGLHGLQSKSDSGEQRSLPEHCLPSPDEVPTGVDPEVWPQIPPDCRAWAVSAHGSVIDLSEAEKVNAAPRQLSCLKRRQKDMKLLEPEEKKICDKGTRSETRAPAPETCIICYVRSKTHAFVPCGHQCVCEKCGKFIVQGQGASCPVCRAEVHIIMQIFR